MKVGFLSKHEDDSTETVFRPQLTSLIDVMTFLLVFLIKSFSVEGDIITPASNLQLPLSTSQKKPKPSLTLEITDKAITCEGRMLAKVSDSDKKDPQLLPGVHDWMLVQKASKADTVFSNDVLLQADREIDFALLKRVMYTCSKAGFSDFTILAVKKE